jgi:hypothetical protein
VLRFVILVAVAACGNRADPDPARDASEQHDGYDGAIPDATTTDAPSTTVDAAAPDAPAFPAKLDLEINCRNDCVLIANPSSIAVPAGTEFTVNWINVGDTECGVAKIDQFNQVPIIIGLEPGTSYHDTVREWCGAFTGTFNFRVTICTIHSYIPVDCDA